MKAATAKKYVAENLFNLGYTVNRTFIKNPIENPNKPGDFFSIEKPTCFSLGYMRKEESEQVEKIFKQLKLVYSKTYYPAGYMKNQPADLHTIEIELGYTCKQFECNLIEFGYSYGKLEFEGNEFMLSHSGGTYQGGWKDTTESWHIMNNCIAFAESVKSKLKPVTK